MKLDAHAYTRRFVSQPKQLNYGAGGVLSYSVICVKWLIKGELIILAQDPVTALT